jgi:ABC-type sugar transport system permease subunit
MNDDKNYMIVLYLVTSILLLFYIVFLIYYSFENYRATGVTDRKGAGQLNHVIQCSAGDDSCKKQNSNAQFYNKNARLAAGQAASSSAAASAAQIAAANVGSSTSSFVVSSINSPISSFNSSSSS